MNIKKLTEDINVILNERGGSDYGDFASAVRKDFEDHTSQFFKVLISYLHSYGQIYDKVQGAIDNLEGSDAIGKKGRKLLVALIEHMFSSSNVSMTLTEIADIDDDDFYELMDSIDNDERSSDLINDLVKNGAKYLEDLKNKANRLINTLSDRQSAFKANKQMVINAIKKATDEDIKQCTRIVNMIKQQWPKGVRSNTNESAQKNEALNESNIAIVDSLDVLEAYLGDQEDWLYDDNNTDPDGTKELIDALKIVIDSIKDLKYAR